MKSSFAHRWYVVANPAAGNDQVKRQLDRIVVLFNSHNLDFTLVKTEYKNHASLLTQEGIRKGFRKIIAIGGDGTNNEAINGIMSQTEVNSQEITYCLLPVGTGNDWVKEHQIPMKLSAWMEVLKTGNTFLQDIGLVKYYKNDKEEKRYFTNVAGMAYDAYVLSEMDKRKRPLTNRLAYLFFGLYYVFKYKLQKARVHFNGKTVEDYFYLINAGICRYSGGGMQFVPHAIPDDGKIALTLAGRFTKIGVLLNSYRFYNGRIAGHSKVDIFQTDHIKVEAVDQAIMVEVDGELLGETPVEFSIIAKALKIIKPK